MQRPKRASNRYMFIPIPLKLGKRPLYSVSVYLIWYNKYTKSCRTAIAADKVNREWLPGK